MRGIPALVLAGWLGLAGQADAQDIVAADYAEPTLAYPHGVLGDEEEWAALMVTVREASGEGTRTYRIPARADMVFEDTAPRLWDITGDGLPEVVAVAAHQRYGAQLVVLGLVGGTIGTIASTPMIGTRFRWLAPVGAADLDGDGHIEIAYVDRPHLAKTLRVWRFTPESFTEIATLTGLTNHRIGEDFITGGLRNCGQGPEMILADARWSRILAVRLGADGLAATPIEAFRGRASVDAQLGCPD
ncbi:VCBS repeat-containing protein [Aestuariivita sp.]|jgi:hypothetical protein|uniref:FG-GAP repeat domain-containing protein n=1 Tax=Aestuariivita sp. TaxID=1872407 RepID=UPI00216D25B1|nr:VCBS repeat-containing protein [Aestuariivita sp.]MCE8007926.1 VCBS repeat-containing protein [Aestuariivita sp.]